LRSSKFCAPSIENKESIVRIVVTGSMAYDYIMNFPGDFKDHILPDKVHMLTVSFLVDSMRRMRGGVAGNVAYSLALLGERPLVVATVGQDFGEYRAYMESQGIDTSGIVAIEDEFTASCFINTDRSNNQIVAFYTGAMAHSKELSLLDLGLGPDDLVLISPTDPEAMNRYTDECRRMGVPFLFDPGKQTPRLETEQILNGLNGASILVGNDYEFAMLAKKIGWTEEQLIASAPLTVITRGGEGSSIYRQGEVINIPAVPLKEIVDPTGAGDAYLAGLVFGLARHAIEQRGCQEHFFTRSDFVARYTETFGPESAIEILEEVDVHS
jgi:adenosine kinase